MKPRKTKTIIKVLKKKGFILNPEKDHHQFYYLTIDGKKQSIYTYFSHGKAEYDKNLMGKLKSQLKFQDPKLAEDFFDCPLTKEMYIAMLEGNNEL